MASVRTVFYAVISPPHRPKFRFLLGFPRLTPPLSEVSFPNRLPLRNFFEILRFSRGFFPPRRSSFCGLFPVLRGIFSVVCCVILLPFFFADPHSALSLNRLSPSISPLSSAFSPPAAAVFQLSACLDCLSLGSPLPYIAFSSAYFLFQSRFAVSALIPCSLPPPASARQPPKRGLPAVRVERRAKEFGRGK